MLVFVSSSEKKSRNIGESGKWTQKISICCIQPETYHQNITFVYIIDFEEHKILKVSNIYEIKSAKFMHKYVNKKLPDYFQNYFKKVSGSHDYSTWAATNDHLTIPFFRTRDGNRSGRPAGRVVGRVETL